MLRNACPPSTQKINHVYSCSTMVFSVLKFYTHVHEGAKTIQWRKYFQQMVLGKLHIHKQKDEVGPFICKYNSYGLKISGLKLLGWPKSLFSFSCKIKDTFFIFTNNFIDLDILSMLASSCVVEH